MIEVAWTPPPRNFYKINIDGSHQHSGFSACGGLVRDSNGAFIHGFYCCLGAGNATWAKLWGLHLGVKLARELQLQNVLFEMDSLVVVNMVNAGRTENANFRPLVDTICSELRKPDWRPSVSHIYREANRCADFLAKQGLEASVERVLVDTVSPSLGLLLAADAQGCCLPRGVA